MLLLSFCLQCVCLGVVQGLRRGDYYKPSAFPWLAGLLNEEWAPRCSGTVISRFYVLTASACLVHKTNRSSWDLIDPDQYFVVIPAESPTDIVRAIDVILLHPNVTEGPMYNAGLIGIWPFLKFSHEEMILPFWSEDANFLTGELNYVLKTIETFRCFLVTWQDIFTGIYSFSHPPYKVNLINAIEVRPRHESECQSLLCTKSSNNSSCQTKLNGTMCLTIVRPANGQLCGADRGAGLSCSHFLWGVLIGGASCTNPDLMPITLRIDMVADFIFDNYNKPYRRATGKSSETKPTIRHSQFVLIQCVILMCYL